MINAENQNRMKAKRTKSMLLIWLASLAAAWLRGGRVRVLAR